MRLSGFTSRCTTPCEWAHASASQSTTPMAAATSAGISGAACSTKRRSVGPSSSSVTMYERLVAASENS
jgi:hypothetical protein